MAGITLAQAQSKLDLYLAAQEKIIKGQSTSIDGEALTRADFGEVERAIKYWDGKVKELAFAGRGRARTVSVDW